MAGYGNGYGNGGGYGGGGNGGGGRVSFAKGSINANKQPKNEASRHLQGKLKFSDNTERWISSWINGPKDNPNAQAAIAHIRDIIAREQLYITIDVGDIAPPKQQGQGGGYGGGQAGGGYGQQQPQGGNYGAPPQQQGFGGGFGGQGGPGGGQGGFR